MSNLEDNQVKSPAAPAQAEPAETSSATVAVEPNGVVAARKNFWAVAWSDRKGTPLVGNKLRPLRGGVTALLGGLLAFLLMALDAQFRWGVPLGILGIFVASFGG